MLKIDIVNKEYIKALDNLKKFLNEKIILVLMNIIW